VVAFQPHRYTRTRDCFEDFVHLLSHEAQVVVLTEVYPAGEAPIFGADGRSLARAIRLAGGADLIYEQRVDDVPAAILKVVRDGDVVITLGAGSIGHVASKVTELSKNEGDRA
jgi:UDP-N-acetylmuramate--alanine ligase